MTKENSFEQLETEILSLNEKSKKSFVYKLEQGKFRVGYNKRTKNYYYHLNGMAVEEFDTNQELLQAIKGFF